MVESDRFHTLPSKRSMTASRTLDPAGRFSTVRSTSSLLFVMYERMPLNGLYGLSGGS